VWRRFYAAKEARTRVQLRYAAERIVLLGGTSSPASQVELWRAATLCDVTVTTQGGATFEAHKLVLAGGSSTLRGLLTSEMRDSAEPCLARNICHDLLHRS